MLPRNHRQEALSRAYVRAVAGHAGLLCNDFDEDFGIDMCLREVDELGRRYFDSGDQLDLQVRSTTRAAETAAGIAYDIDVRTYDLLRRERPQCPRILVLLVLPVDEAEWLSHSVESLVLRRCAYWHSLRGAEATTAHTTIRITLPVANVFSVEAVQNLMRLIRQGGAP